MKATFFATQQDFRKWLEANHKSQTELIVGYYKVGCGKPSMTWSESVDQALCFGWIDGVRRSIDAESYCIRFTPRRPASIWSAINIRKVEALTKAGLMRPEGIQAFEFRKDHKSQIYSYENDPLVLEKNLEKLFKREKSAWKFFTAQAPSYQKRIVDWIMGAKQEITRVSRLEKVITASAENRRV